MNDLCLRNYTRQPDHDQIDAEIQAFIQRGGRIESIPRGVSSQSDGLYGSIGAHVRKTRKQRIIPDEEFDP